MAKRMQHGFAARSGLLAVLLARDDYTGIEQVLERPYGGFLNCFSLGTTFGPQYVPEQVVSELGDRWETEGVRVKVHAAMAALHTGIDCLEHLQKQYPERFAQEKLGEIEDVEVQLARAAYEHGGWVSDPGVLLTTLGAQMSIQYAAAAQLVDGEVLMSLFGADKLDRPIVRELMEKVKPVYNAEFDSDSFKTCVTVNFTDGALAQQTLNAARGIDPPCSNEDIVAKWRAPMKGVIDEDKVAEIENMVLEMESLDDVASLAKLLQVNATCPIKVDNG
jgi:aconitate decarboxylase